MHECIVAYMHDFSLRERRDEWVCWGSAVSSHGAHLAAAGLWPTVSLPMQRRRDEALRSESCGNFWVLSLGSYQDVDVLDPGNLCTQTGSTVPSHHQENFSGLGLARAG